MTLLQVADLRFGYAGDTLFEGVTFGLDQGDRVALVAPNGSGKSTLLRLMAREIEPDAGSVVLRKDVTLAYYRQSHELSSHGDVMAAFLSGFREIVELREQLQRAQEQAASGTTQALDELSRVTDAYHLARGDELEHRVEALASHLGFADRDLSRPVASLSGGERGRLGLGVVLAQQPDVLLLDEPTNHLDLDTIAWLESWLSDYRGALLIVSHDRAFLDNTTTATMELGKRSFRSYPLRYSDYVVARAEDLARERALAERQQGLIAKTEDFIRKNIAGQKTKQAQSRRKMLDKLDRVERPEDVWATAERGGPEDRGTVKRGTNLQEGYFDQQLGDVDTTVDIPAAEILEEALTTFDGTVLLVSHDRRFLENVTTRVVSVRDGKAAAYPGGFKDYERFGTGKPACKAPSAAPPPKKQKESKDAGAGKVTKDPAVTKFEEQRLAARAAEKKKRRIQELETGIAAGEKDLDVLRGKLKTAPGDAPENDWEKLAKMAQEEQALTRKVDTLLVEWARLSEEVS